MAVYFAVSFFINFGKGRPLMRAVRGLVSDIKN